MGLTHVFFFFFWSHTYCFADWNKKKLAPIISKKGDNQNASQEKENLKMESPS
jgi:hypothetical protein